MGVANELEEGLEPPGVFLGEADRGDLDTPGRILVSVAVDLDVEAQRPLGGLGGLALGATWAADRVYMQRISPPRYLGEFYGLYATVGRFATLLGPLVWGIAVTVLGLPREFALGALIVFIAVGRWVLQGVDDVPREWGASDLAPA